MHGVPTLERFTTDALRHTVITFRDTLQQHASRLNRLNVYPVPDGDTGTNMARTLDAVVAEMEHPDSSPGTHATVYDAISHGSLMGARGNSGVILSQILRGISVTLKDATEATGAKVADALHAASNAAYDAVLRPIEGTILTVVRESADAARIAADDGGSLAEVLRRARSAAKDALDRTPEMLPVLKDAGVVDAGGAGYLLLLDSALHVVDGAPIPASDDAEQPSAQPFAAPEIDGAHPHGTGDVADLRYEVMFFLDIDDASIGEFKHQWGAIGDSIVVVGGDGLFNCHVHTNDIGAAIEAALVVGGRPRQIRVTDLFDEVAELDRREHHRRDAALHAAHVELPAVTTAVVAVASGSGLAELFTDLGVQAVVHGGQTLNPSTAELLEAVERCNSRQVVLLPNNKNIIPVAEQVDALTEKHVRVVPTVSMPAALAALVTYDPTADVADNAEAMSTAAAAVRTGELTAAVRDSASDAGPVHAGDWIGLVRGDGIVAVSADMASAATSLLQHLLLDGGELVTIVTGADATDDGLAAITEWLAEHPAAPEIEVHRGGQPLYPYLFGVE
jgi:DAK2 domain fusion protein YloV